MRHYVNFGLLIAFGVLAFTGVLSFVRPFSLTTTHIHIAAGLLTICLVIWHLSVRLGYLKSRVVPGGSQSIGWWKLFAITIVIGLPLILAAYKLQPFKWLCDQSYEAQTSRSIVRSSSLTGLIEPNERQKLIVRKTKSNTNHKCSVYVSTRDGLEYKPAIAVWAESVTGSLIETLYLQPALAYSDEPLWGDIRTNRSKILPIWRHRFTLVSGIDPQGDLDGVTGATEKHRFALDPYLEPGKENKFVVCVEVNLPFDSDEQWTDRKLGQPSVLYTALIEVDGDQRYSLLELTGHGGGAEIDGNINYDLDEISTAKQIVDLLLVKLEEPQDVTK